MPRRTIRLKREYLYRKNLEGKERLLYEKKRKIRQALEEGKPIPTELRNEEAALRRQIDLEDDHTAIPRSIIDDEYAKATEREPKILITTSRDPSQPLTQFAKELKFVFPNAERMNRGGQLGERAAAILKHLFPVPKPDSKRIITFANQSDYISFRHHVYEKQGGPKSIELKEIGPRFELRLYQIKLGTVEQKEAQNEWVLRPYMNTTKKRKFLGD